MMSNAEIFVESNSAPRDEHSHNCGTIIEHNLNAAINIHALGFNSAPRTLSTWVTKYDEVFTRIKETR